MSFRTRIQYILSSDLKSISLSKLVVKIKEIIVILIFCEAIIFASDLIG